MAGGKHALVIGASGLIGWAVVDQLLQPYPSSSPFGKITALVNRPLKKEDSLWPEESLDRPTLSLASGVNLQCEDDELEGLLKEKVPDAESITHVFYFGGFFLR
jgi:nucleoside-diphosphate-sugar epimerase